MFTEEKLFQAKQKTNKGSIYNLFIQTHLTDLYIKKNAYEIFLLKEKPDQQKLQLLNVCEF